MVKEQPRQWWPTTGLRGAWWCEARITPAELGALRRAETNVFLNSIRKQDRADVGNLVCSEIFTCSQKGAGRLRIGTEGLLFQVLELGDDPPGTMAVRLDTKP